MTKGRCIDEYQYRQQIHPSILERDDYTCQECGECSDEHGLRVHHIVPRSDGGTDAPDNLSTLCAHCHALAHQPDSWNHLMRASALRSIRRKREMLAEMTSRFMAALYGQENLPCDLWEGELVIFYPEDE